jgi:hypothetical protein
VNITNDLGEVRGYENQDTTVPEEAPQAQANEGTTFEELAQKKGYSSPNELARDYALLESHNKKVEMTNAELAKARHATSDEGTTNAPADNSELAKVKRELQEVRDRQEINDLMKKYDDFPKYGKQMAAYIKEHPHASWESAFKVTSYDDHVGGAKQAGRDEAYQNIDKKQSLAVEPARGRTQQPTIGDISSMLKDKSMKLSDIEKMLPHR